MTDTELKDSVIKSFTERKGEFNLLKKSANDFLLAVLGDCKEVVSECVTAKQAGCLIIDVLDDLTNTGALDMVDSTLAKFALGHLLNDSAESKWTALRAKILGLN